MPGRASLRREGLRAIFLLLRAPVRIAQPEDGKLDTSDDGKQRGFSQGIVLDVGGQRSEPAA